MQWAEKFGEKKDVCNAIGAHHDEIEMDNLISPIVPVCDAISGSRSGSRRQVMESYIQRLKDLEKMKLNNKYIIGCHVMFYEIDMVEEYLNSVHLALQDIENKENVKVEMMWNLSQYFEECESGEKLFEIKQRINDLEKC